MRIAREKKRGVKREEEKRSEERRREEEVTIDRDTHPHTQICIYMYTHTDWQMRTNTLAHTQTRAVINKHTENTNGNINPMTAIDSQAYSTIRQQRQTDKSIHTKYNTQHTPTHAHTHIHTHNTHTQQFLESQ